MADLPSLSSAEYQCLKDFIYVAIEHDKAFLTDDDLNQYSNEFSIPALFLQKFINSIVDKGVFYSTSDSYGNGYHVHSDYLDAVFLLSQKENIFKPLSVNGDEILFHEFTDEFTDGKSNDTGIPAADRFVSRSDNEEAADAANQALSDLSEKIRASNQLNASQEERAALSREVAGISDLVSQSAIRVSAIWDAVNGSGVLRWLAERTADAGISALAREAIKHLSKLCGFG